MGDMTITILITTANLTVFPCVCQMETGNERVKRCTLDMHAIRTYIPGLSRPVVPEPNSLDTPDIYCSCLYRIALWDFQRPECGLATYWIVSI